MRVFCVGAAAASWGALASWAGVMIGSGFPQALVVLIPPALIGVLFARFDDA